MSKKWALIVVKSVGKNMWLQLQNLEEVSNADGRRGAGENMTRNIERGSLREAQRKLIFLKRWLPSAKLKPTFTFLVRDFVIFNTFSWQKPYHEK